VSWVCLSRVCLCTDPLIFELYVLQDDLNCGKNSKMSVKYVSIKLRLGNNQSSEDWSFPEIGRSENGRFRRMVVRRMVAFGDSTFGDWSFGDWSFGEWSFGEWSVYRELLLFDRVDVNRSTVVLPPIS
jgi:hypothetical protein